MTAIMGFLFLAISVLTAYRVPITGYELSIYAPLPPIIWILFGLSVAISIGNCIGSETHFSQLMGIILALLLVFSFTALPVIRGYHFYASSDTFAHLGRIQDIIAGHGVPENILYPGSHILTAELSLITGQPARRTILFMIPIFAFVFCISIEVTSRLISPTRHHLGVGVLTGVVLAPIMTVQLPNLQMSPLTLAVLYFSFVLLTFSLYQLRNDDQRVVFIYLISIPILVLLHPLVAVAMASFITGIAFLRVLISDSRTTMLFPGPLQTFAGAGALLGILTYLQIAGNPTVHGAISSILVQLQTDISPTGGVAARTGGLQSIGASIWNILAKIFAAKVILTVLAAAALIQSLKNYISNNITRTSELRVTYALAVIPIGVLAGIVFATGRVNLVTRYLGVILVIVSVFAAIGIGIIRTSQRTKRMTATGLWFVLVLMVLVAGPSLFTSPYLYQDTPHVSDSEWTGYATLFEYRAVDVEIGTTRSSISRYRTAQFGQRVARGHGSRKSNSEVLADIENERTKPFFFPYNFNGGYPSQTISQKTYLVLPASDRVVDLVLYDGLRYTRDDYVRVERDPNGAHIYSNGGFDVHLYQPTD